MDRLRNEFAGLAFGTVEIVDNADWCNKTSRCLALEQAGFWATTLTANKVTLRKDLSPSRVYR